MIQKLEGTRNISWRDFAQLAKCMIILRPEKAAKLNIDQAWPGMMHELRGSRNMDWRGFARLAMNMKILVADKVEATDQGLKITMHSPEFFKQAKNPRPKRKTF